MIWGVKDVRSINGKPFRMTDGIKTQITQYGGNLLAANTGAVAGNLSRSDLEDYIRRVFNTNVKGQPNERIAFCGDLVLQILNRQTMLDGTQYVNSGDTKVGIAVTTIMTPFGKLSLMTHPLMNENPVWQHEMYVLHPGAIRRRMLRETFQESYDSSGDRINGVDADQGTITTEMGIEVGAAQTMGILSNVQLAVKST